MWDFTDFSTVGGVEGREWRRGNGDGREEGKGEGRNGREEKGK